MSAKLQDEKQILNLLHNVVAFYNLDDKTLKEVLKMGNQVTFPPSKVIVKEGDRETTMYLVLSGGVEVRKKGNVIAKLGAGQFFGEMAFLDNMPTERSADVVAIEETSCFALPAWGWYDFLKKNPEVAIEVIRALAVRLRELNQRLAY